MMEKSKPCFHLSGDTNSSCFEVLGHVSSCFPEKFGVPRQPGLAKNAKGTVVLLPEFSREEMVRGLDGFSHIWINFIFHGAVKDGWRSTVRPPRLGGQKRQGVFASRSPHRPNFIGMSVVKLEGIEFENNRCVLGISGIDILDKSPVVDIKPYLSYCDMVPGTRLAKDYSMVVTGDWRIVFSMQAETYCNEYIRKTGRNLKGLLVDIISQDPRPVNQHSKKKEFGVLLWDVNTIFCYSDKNTIEVVRCEGQAS